MKFFVSVWHKLTKIRGAYIHNFRCNRPSIPGSLHTYFCFIQLEKKINKTNLDEIMTFRVSTFINYYTIFNERSTAYQIV